VEGMAQSKIQGAVAVDSGESLCENSFLDHSNLLLDCHGFTVGYNAADNQRNVADKCFDLQHERQ